MFYIDHYIDHLFNYYIDLQKKGRLINLRRPSLKCCVNTSYIAG